VQSTKNKLNDTTFTSIQLNYATHGSCLLAARKLMEAKEAFLKASELNKQSPDEPI